MTDDTQKAEELLQESKEQSRHTSEPDVAESGDDSKPDRVEAIKQALLEVMAGEHPENINIRDARLKALLIGLEAAGELEAVVNELADELGTRVEDPTQSDVARLLIRVGLNEVLPELLEDGREANQEAALEMADEF